MKKIIAITSSILLLTFFSTIPAHADRKTVEGFMLGTGVAILTAAIFNGMHNSAPPQYTKNHSRHDKGYAGYRYGHLNKHPRKYHRPGPRGHWVIEKIWIAPVYEKKWNPGHYNRRGAWVNGRYENFLVQNGLWQENKIWVIN